MTAILAGPETARSESADPLGQSDATFLSVSDDLVPMPQVGRTSCIFGHSTLPLQRAAELRQRQMASAGNESAVSGAQQAKKVRRVAIRFGEFLECKVGGGLVSTIGYGQMMNTSESKARYDEDGFVVVRGVLSGEDLAKLNREIERYIREVVPTLSKEDAAFYQDPGRPETLKQLPRMARDPFFASYRKDAKWIELATVLIGEACEAKVPQWLNKPPGTVHPTPPHQDNFYLCLRPPNVLTMWLSLDEADEETGCLRFVPKSHLKGLRPHAQTSVLGFSQGITDYGSADYEAEVCVRTLPGDLVVHHGETIHRADPNRSTVRHRRAFAMVFHGVSCRLDEEAKQRYFISVANQHAQLGIPFR